MAYTEIKERKNKKYYYRVRTIRDGKKFRKDRIYLGVNLNENELFLREKTADERLKPIKELKRIEKLKPKIIKILKKYNIKRAGIFGSYVRGEEEKGSDIDILVEPPKGIGFGFVKIEFELENELKINVDLVSYNGLSPHLKDRILKEEVRIL